MLPARHDALVNISLLHRGQARRTGVSRYRSMSAALRACWSCVSDSHCDRPSCLNI